MLLVIDVRQSHSQCGSHPVRGSQQVHKFRYVPLDVLLNNTPQVT